MAFLSKSKYLDGLKCPKLLWYEYNRKQEIPEPDALTKMVMEEGNRVGAVAQRIFLGGVKIERDRNPLKTHERSLRALAARRPLFEAGFVYNNAYALADMLVPVDGDAWDLIEVKSASAVKGDYYNDVAFQKYTYTGAGLKLRKCYLMYLNREYVKRGEIEPEKLLKKDDITSTVDERLPGIEQALNTLLKTIAEKDAPDVKVGTQCAGCPLEDLCWHFLPEENHVFVLHRGEKTAFELIEQGIFDIKDIPADYELSERHEIQRQAILSGKAHLDKSGIGDFLSRLDYPLYFLDFETIAPAIPIYDLTHPYEDVPFQFSLHVVDKEGAEPDHHAYLAPGDVDPRPEVLKRLKLLLLEKGSILVYNASYELLCLKRAAEAYPEYREWVGQVEKRLVDLWEPFKQFYYYHPDQQESTSMKSVLPTFRGSSYEGLEIGEGWKARTEYMRVTFDKNVDEKERRRVRGALEKYCDMDTGGMVEIVEGLRKA